MINIVIYCCNTAFNIIPAFEVEIFHFWSFSRPGGLTKPLHGAKSAPYGKSERKKSVNGDPMGTHLPLKVMV